MSELHEKPIQAEIPLRPGFLVALTTTTRPKHPGAIHIERIDKGETTLSDGSSRRRWETVRTSIDPEEEQEASKCRLRAANKIRAVCVKTPFVLVCPEDEMDKMDGAVREAMAIVDGFNSSSRHFQISLRTMRARIMEGQEETVSALRGLMGDLMEDMREAVSLGDIGSIRDLATKAREYGKMLEPESDVRNAVDSAINAARRVAREIVNRVEKGTETIEDVLRTVDQAPISAARFMVIDRRESLSADESFQPEESVAIEAEEADDMRETEQEATEAMTEEEHPVNEETKPEQSEEDDNDERPSSNRFGPIARPTVDHDGDFEI